MQGPGRRGLAVGDALRLILDTIAPLPSVEVPIARAAGLVLAERVVAVDDVPLLDNSAMDGFAVRSRELEAASTADPVVLRLLPGLVAAGPGRPSGLAHGATIRITTGGLIPPGADAVVAKEDVEVDEGAGEVRFLAPVPAGRHIRSAGQDLRAGAIALESGVAMTPWVVGVAAVAGRARVAVHRRPRVAVLTGGDEVVAPESALTAGQVRNANTPVLAALLENWGAEVVDLGIVPDERLAYVEALTMARRADAVVTSGGVSMGEKDLLRPVLDGMGFREKFWRVDLKPGRPLLFGLLGETPLFGLPGNPVSAAVTAEVFVRPALRRMLGHTRLFRPVVPAVFTDEVRRSPGRPELLRVVLERVGAGWAARATRAEQGSDILTSLVGANGLAWLDADREVVRAGESRPCLLLEDPGAASFDLA